MIDDRDVSLNRSIKMWKNIPLDDRVKTESLLKIDEYIQFPYIGMIFYSELEDDFYKVTGLADGYKVLRTGSVTREKNPGSIKIENYFIGTYEQLTLKGNLASSITKAEIRNGYLYITFFDGKEVNAGYVMGEDGFSPQISENVLNNLDINVGKLIYKLDILFKNKKNLPEVLTTENLIGPYIEDIKDGENGYLDIFISNGTVYSVGPYGIKDMELKGNDLYIYNWDGTVEIIKNIKGEKGDSVRILATLESVDDLPTFSNKPGDSYIINGYLYTYDSTENNFKNVGRICGYDGKDGNTPKIVVKTEKINGITHVSFLIDGKDSYDFKVEDGFSPTVSVKESTEDKYILEIVTKNKFGTIVSIETINLKGKDGSSIVYKDSLDSVDELRNIVDPKEGDTYLINGHLWLYNGNELDDSIHKYGFKDLGNIKGPQGDKGAKGESIYIISSIKEENVTTVTFSDGSQIKIEDGLDGVDGKSLEFKWDGTKLGIRKEGESSFSYVNLQGPKGSSGSDGSNIEIISNTKDEETGITTIVFSDGNTIEIKDGQNGLDGKDGKDGKDGQNGKDGENGLDGTDGVDGKSLEFNWDGTRLGIRKEGETDYQYVNLKGDQGDTGLDGESITITSIKKLNGITTIVFSDGNSIEINDGLTGADGENGKSLEFIWDGTRLGIRIEGETNYQYSDLKGNDGREIELRKTENYIQWKYIDEEENSWRNLIEVNSIIGTDGVDGKSLEFNWDGTNLGIRKEGETEYQYVNLKGEKGDIGLTGEDGNDGREIELQSTETTIQWRYVGDSNWIDLISIELLKGSDGQDGVDGREIELQSTESMIQWRYVGDIDWNDLISIESITGPQGEPGLDSEVSITENPDNTDGIYKLDISYTSKGEEVSFTTPNLKGSLNNLYEILETLPETDTEGTLDTNHIYMVLKNGVVGITSKEANYDKYIILNIAEDKTITWEKIETTEASGNILVLINGDEKTEATLPDIEFASTNFIYCLLTPEYQRGLNIGLTNDSNSNKNFYEEWIVIETETEKKWELLGPQIYRISASMIDYIWKFADKFTVYDDWDVASDIPEYQKKNYGDATPLNNFIFRLVPNGSTYNLILVKEVSSGKINKLSIAPQYKVKLNGTTYTCTVTELDGTYDENYTYYESDAEGNVTIKTYGTEEDFGTQSVFSGVEVYGVYIADTVKKITRAFLYTSNMSAYHIPYDLEIIGDYAFYNTKSPTVQFEKLINNGKDVEVYPLEESKVKAIGVHAFDGNSNLAFLIRNEDGTTKDSNIVRTPATLKKISDYAFYNTRISTLDTNLSSNLYIGDHAFVQCVHGGQTLSPTTYYTDATFLGVNGLTHDTINYSSAGVSNWFEGQEHAGHNYNFDSGHETDVLHVTLNSVDPDWSLQ